MAEKGRFIVVEGLEGAGKSTAMHTISNYLASHINAPVLTTREPGGTQVGEMIRTIFKQQHDEPLHAYTELLLLYASRVQLVEQVIRPALEHGTWVVADRFELSTFAYQGGGRQVDSEIIAQLSKLSLRGFKPDLLLFLDINPLQGLERTKVRGYSDRIEEETVEFFNQVHQAYHQQLKNSANAVIIDANQPLELVQQAINHHLDQFIHHG